MCYRPISASGKIPRVAVKPINVFKVVWKLGDVYEAYYFCFTYEKGKRYKTRLNKYQGGYVLDGFHSYSEKTVTFVNDGDWRLEIKSKKNGSRLDFFHFLCGREHDADTQGLTIMKCHIPRWARYYINQRGEVVSNRIVVDEFINAKIP